MLQENKESKVGEDYADWTGRAVFVISPSLIRAMNERKRWPTPKFHRKTTGCALRPVAGNEGSSRRPVKRRGDNDERVGGDGS